MTKKSSFGNKLLFQVLSVTVLAFALTIFFVSKYSFETSEEDAKIYIKELAGKYAAEIQTEVNSSVTIAEILASKYQAALSSGHSLNEQEVIDFATSILEKNRFIVGIWFKIKEKELFFKANDEKKGVPPYDKTGQFNPYIATANGKVTIASGSPYAENLEWVKGPKDTGKMYITKPYMYPVDGVDVLMSTVAVPLYNNGEFIGSIGIDITMDTFSKMAKSIKLYDNGYAFIADHHKYVIGHPTEKFVGKYIPDITNNSQQHNELLANTKRGENTLFYKDSLKDGITSLYYAKAFKIGNGDINWSFVLVAPVDEYLAQSTFIRNFSILAGLAGLVVIALVIIFSIRKLNFNLESISTGLNDFFEYLNKKTSNPRQIELQSTDEFGIMAKSINENVQTIREGIEKDNALIDEVKDIVNSIAGGFLDKRINRSTSTESLNELKTLLNDMLNNLEEQVGKDLNKISNILSMYSQREFTAKLDAATSGKIGEEIIKMNNMITQMLTDNKRDGLSLQRSSNELTSNVRTLSNNATSQASSLEETAASIDEITSNIEQTSQKAQEMLDISNDTKNSATQGKDLANQTVKAMDEINETVFAINDAISVIDQIAFQTNILSLNAAVEAATAGEAGKGFAVVAQEVRNLASRSAEAAKEIKELVETATVKANSGKSISSSMIEGFSQLEEKIVDTSKLIDDVTNAAKEQSIGMTQIADAVGQLDQFTQENAAIADKTNTIAQGTNTIAQEVVASVDKNNFDGKNSIKAQVQEHHETVEKKTFVKKAITPKKVVQKQVVKEEKNHDEWESF